MKKEQLNKEEADSIKKAKLKEGRLLFDKKKRMMDEGSVIMK